MINSLMKHVGNTPFDASLDAVKLEGVARAHWNLPPQNLFYKPSSEAKAFSRMQERWPYRPVHLLDVRPRIASSSKTRSPQIASIGATSTSRWRRPISTGYTKTSRGI